MRLALSLVAAACSLAVSPLARADDHASHVLVVVMDGMRPDSVTPQDMPNLYKLAREGVLFTHHHPVYLSSTEVNGTALATGCYPSHSGVMANKEYRPDIDPKKAIGIDDEEAVAKGDELSHGQFLHRPTVAEILRSKGLPTLMMGTKAVAILLDRTPRPNTAAESPTIYHGKAIPESALPTTLPDGPFPPVADATKAANIVQDHWTTHLLVDRIAQSVPAFTMLWLSEPDYGQHGSGPNSPVARAGLQGCDRNLGRVLEALDKAGHLQHTDIMVVSDHGFSTVASNFDAVALLKKAGFAAFSKFAEAPKTGDVLVVGNGGSMSLYVSGHDEDVTRRLVTFLQTQPFTGVIFTQKEMPGTFTLGQAAINTTDAPDIDVALRWTGNKSRYDMPGMLISEGNKRGPGDGNHASLSRYDMHNTLIAAGPDFKKGFVDDFPSGNTDVAPTVLWILGVPQPVPMDGRVLGEALVHGPASDAQPQTKTIVAKTTAGDTPWQQYLKVSTVGTTSYWDEGNGDQNAH
jgi:arylsulfatase A-like enzyme